MINTKISTLKFTTNAIIIASLCLLVILFVYSELKNTIFKAGQLSITTDDDWHLQPIANNSTPKGWIIVPGNTHLGTFDFLVMKYHAKCADDSDPYKGLTTPSNEYNIYNNLLSDCTSEYSKHLVSTSSGYAIANISKFEASAYCKQIKLDEVNTHLITNKEWMTIVNDASLQNIN